MTSAVDSSPPLRNPATVEIHPDSLSGRVQNQRSSRNPELPPTVTVTERVSGRHCPQWCSGSSALGVLHGLSGTGEINR